MRKKIAIRWAQRMARKADECPSTEMNIDDHLEMQDEIMVTADVDQDGQWIATWTEAKEKVSSEVMIIEITAVQ